MAGPVPAGLVDRREAAGDPVVEVRDLVRDFDVSASWLHRALSGEKRRIVKAVGGVSFDIRRGETLALVGESGSGKSTIARMIVGLLPPTSGSVRIEGIDIWDRRNAAQLKDLRRRFQMIFQDPFASLNPRWRVRDIIAEPLEVFRITTSSRATRERVGELLTTVRLAPEDGEKYPHQFSGGQRQRIAIARALASEPEMLVCDEPTSALDVSVQAQILNLMKDLQDRLGLTYLFISHNLAVVRHMADRIGVLYLGRLAEVAPGREMFRNPRHPYTRSLIDAIPDVDMTGRERQPITGEIPNPLDPPSGCSFHPRCPFMRERCRAELPVAIAAGPALVACHGVAEGWIADAARAPGRAGSLS
jgi:peptide/nickel transport system ATP-binding protein